MIYGYPYAPTVYEPYDEGYLAEPPYPAEPYDEPYPQEPPPDANGYDAPPDPGAYEGPPQPGIDDAPAGVDDEALEAEAYQAAPESQVQSLVVDGADAFAAGRYDEARSLFVSAVMADERDGYAKLLFALANVALGDYQAAAASLRRALWTTPQLIEYPLDVRSLYDNRLAFSAHLSELTEHTRANPQDREARFLLGYLLYAVGEPLQAVAVFDVLADLDQNDELVSKLTQAAQEKITPPDDDPTP